MLQRTGIDLQSNLDEISDKIRAEYENPIRSTLILLTLLTNIYMWLPFIENPETISSIYGDNIPALKNIYLHEVKISTGANINCSLRFDISEMPEKKPAKWKQKNANAAQVDLLLISSSIIFFKISDNNFKGDLEISLAENYKKVTFKINKEDIFEIKAKWINIRSITGYFKNPLSAVL